MSEINFISKPATVDMADDWYQFATTQHFWIQGRFNFLIRLLKEDLKSKALFEIGCGNGQIIKQFENKFNLQVDGCDLNTFALKKVCGNNGKLYCLDIFDKPDFLLKKYDGILLMDVIEHIEDDVNFLKTSTEYLGKSGMVIINVPAHNYLFSSYDIAAGHKRRYDKKMMETLFNKCNIEPIVISYWGFVFIPVLFIRNIILRFVKREKTISVGFKPPNKTINKIFNILLLFEKKIFKKSPTGTSLIAIGRLKSN